MLWVLLSLTVGWWLTNSLTYKNTSIISVMYLNIAMSGLIHSHWKYVVLTQFTKILMALAIMKETGEERSERETDNLLYIFVA